MTAIGVILLVFSFFVDRRRQPGLFWAVWSVGATLIVLGL